MTKQMVLADIDTGAFSGKVAEWITAKITQIVAAAIADADTPPPTTTPTPGSAPVLSSSALPAMTQNAAYSQTIATSGGAPTSVTVTAGAVPAGLQVTLSNGTITIAGTPTASGAYTFTLRASNSVGSSEQTYSGTVAAAASPSTLTVRTSDSFNRTSTSDITGSSTDCAMGGSPLVWQSSAAATWAIANNALRAGTTPSGGAVVAWAGADYEISARVETRTSATSSLNWNLDGRRSQLSGSGVTQYRLTLVTNGTVALVKYLSGTPTALWTSDIGVISAGDVVTLRMIGSNISVLRNGVVLQTVVDSSISTSAFAGFSRASSATGGWEDFRLAA